MIFYRTVSTSTYRDYTAYRPQLRRDFEYRCAYCLRHEFHLGGEANCQIDHFRPVLGPYGRPDLECEYTNLYWSCAECNQNKAHHWPHPAEESRGLRFLDPCVPEDDHDLHLQALPDGAMEILSPAGQYTHDVLKLWRDQLKHFRAKCYSIQFRISHLKRRLHDKSLSEEDRLAYEEILALAEEFVNPPLFDRPRSH